MNSRKLLTTGIATALALVPAVLILYLGVFDDGSPALPARAAQESGVPPASSSRSVSTSAEHRSIGPVPAMSDKPVRGPAFAIVRLRPGVRMTVRRAPGKQVLRAIGPRSEFGSPVVLSVVKQRGGWLGVATPGLPNDRLGWIRSDPDRNRLYWTKYALGIDLSARKMRLSYGGTTIGRFVVTIGGAGTETPAGRFGVTDALSFDASPSYGCCALALSAHQERLLPGWLGGDRVAIHGTPGPVGAAESHGCIRATNAAMQLLFKRIPLGTPVFIHQ